MNSHDSNKEASFKTHCVFTTVWNFLSNSRHLLMMNFLRELAIWCDTEEAQSHEQSRRPAVYQTC